MISLARLQLRLSVHGKPKRREFISESLAQQRSNGGDSDKSAYVVDCQRNLGNEHPMSLVTDIALTRTAATKSSKHTIRLNDIRSALFPQA